MDAHARRENGSFKRSSNFVDCLSLSGRSCCQRAISSSRSSDNLFTQMLASVVVGHDVKEGACGD